MKIWKWKLGLFVIPIVVLCFAGLAFGQSMKDVYKATFKAYQSYISNTKTEYEKAMTDALAEFDLFKESKESQSNPQFTQAIDNTLKSLKEADFEAWLARERSPSASADNHKKLLNKAKLELDKAKLYLK